MNENVFKRKRAQTLPFNMYIENILQYLDAAQTLNYYVSRGK